MTALLRRGFLTVLVALGLVLTPSTAPVEAQSSDNVRYAAIVVDAASGEVLFSRYADSRRYPASITKVMTLYLAFEALSEGKINLDDVLTISPHAASMPPSKLGLAAGQRITLDDAMRATAVRSANDMATAIAEHIAGTDVRFGAQMTLKAQELGMTGTRFVNANGLPDPRHVTTARDLSILARAVMRDYPQYYRFFGLHDWVYQGRTYRNTNGLLLTQAGYDGMKTGYTNASGYNLAASKVSDGRRLITIVLGGRSTASRNAHVAALMETGFEAERARGRDRGLVTQAFFEQRGFGVGADTSPVQYASAANDNDDEDGSTAVAYVALASTLPAPTRVTPPPSAARTTPPATTTPAVTPRANASNRPADVTAILNGGSASATRSAPARSTARAAPPAPPAGRWTVQVGAFRDRRVADDWLTEVNRRFRSSFTGAERQVQDADGWFRSRFTGLTEDAAQAACAALAERRVTCQVIRPQQ